MLRLWHHRVMQALIVIACVLALTNCLLWGFDSPLWAFFYGASWTLNAILFLAALEKKRQRKIWRYMMRAGLAMFARALFEEIIDEVRDS